MDSAGRAGSEYLAIIWDTDPGSNHLVIYTEGILGVHASLRQRLSFASTFVNAGGAPAKIDISRRHVTREERRMYGLITGASPQAIAASSDGCFFIEEADVESVRVRYRVFSYRLDIRRRSTSSTDKYEWTPSMNQIRAIRQALTQAFGVRHLQ